MNRPVSTLFAIASAAAALLAVVPASAQSYTTYVQNYDGTTMTPTGITGGPGRAAVTAGQSVTIKAPRSANYDDASQSTALVTVSGATQTVGGTTFTNVASSGSDALNVNWQYTPTTTGPGYEGYTTSTSVNQRPIVDLGGTVSFNMYVFSSMGSSVNTTLEVEEKTTAYYNADLATGPSTAITAASPAPADVLGMRGVDNTAETDIYFVGADGTTATGGKSGATGFPAGGKNVTSGSWQTVTFNLPTDPHALLLDTGGTTGYQTSGLGSIYGIDFIPFNPQSGEVFSVYIDDLTITAAPEPSTWAAMGIGAFALLALGLRARRRSAGQMAC